MCQMSTQHPLVVKPLEHHVALKQLLKMFFQVPSSCEDLCLHISFYRVSIKGLGVAPGNFLYPLKRSSLFLGTKMIATLAQPFTHIHTKTDGITCLSETFGKLGFGAKRKDIKVQILS